MELVHSASHSSRILIGQLKLVEAIRKLSKSCHKLIKNFVEVAMVWCTALLVQENQKWVDCEFKDMSDSYIRRHFAKTKD